MSLMKPTSLIYLQCHPHMVRPPVLEMINRLIPWRIHEIMSLLRNGERWQVGPSWRNWVSGQQEPWLWDSIFFWPSILPRSAKQASLTFFFHCFLAMHRELSGYQASENFSWINNSSFVYAKYLVTVERSNWYGSLMPIIFLDLW